MDNTSDVALRMCDVVFALRAAETYNQTLNRIRLQKYIYLLDVVAILYDLFPAANGHVTYKNGPYDSTIQNAVDALAFRGLVDVLSSRTVGSGAISTQYTLSMAGKAWCDRLSVEPHFQLRWTEARDVAERANRLGWNRLIDLVYAEPTFVLARSRGIGKPLKPAGVEGANANNLLRYVRHALGRGHAFITPRREVLLDLFFAYLDEYASRIAGKTT